MLTLPGVDHRTPGESWTSHLRRAQLEDIEWLLARGVHLDQALHRVGVDKKRYEKWTTRGLA